ncbi:MAG: outer membrane protein assembly factor BamD [Aquirhabdus sp.]
MSLPRLTGLGMPVMALALSGSLLMSACSSLSVNKDAKQNKDTGPTKTEQAYYQAAQHSLERARFEDATKSLEALETYYPVGVYTEQSQLDLMYARYRNSDFPGVISAGDRFIKLYPTNPQVDYAYYLRGVSNMESGTDSLIRYTNLNPAHRDTGYLRAAFDDFRDLIAKYPQSAYAPDAAQRMRYITNQFAEGEMNVARYNIERNAYLAAAERARWVVEYYQQTPQVPEAIATLVYCYQKLGMNDLATQYLNLLKENYPNLVHDNSVNLAEARGEASLVNRMTLGLVGQRSDVRVPTTGQTYQPTTASTETKPSTLNKAGHSLAKAGQNVTRWFGSLLSHINRSDDNEGKMTTPEQISSTSPSAPTKP